MPFVEGFCGAILLVPMGVLFVRAGNWPWKQGKGLSESDNVWAARWALLGGTVSILYGLYLLLDGILGAFKQSMLWQYLHQ